MTENKYSWLDEIINDLLNEVLTAYNERGSTSVTETLQIFHKAYLESKQAIIAKIEAEKAEARINEWKEFQWAHDVSDTIKDIVYVNYIKDRVSGLKMELGELTKELKEEANK